MQADVIARAEAVIGCSLPGASSMHPSLHPSLHPSPTLPQVVWESAFQAALDAAHSVAQRMAGMAAEQDPLGGLKGEQDPAGGQKGEQDRVGRQNGEQHPVGGQKREQHPVGGHKGNPQMAAGEQVRVGGQRGTPPPLDSDGGDPVGGQKGTPPPLDGGDFCFRFLVDRADPACAPAEPAAPHGDRLPARKGRGHAATDAAGGGWGAVRCGSGSHGLVAPPPAPHLADGDGEVHQNG